MSLRPHELAQVAFELQSLVGAPVQKAFAPLPRLAYLEVRTPGRSLLLCLSAEPETSRLSVAGERFPSPPTPSPFQNRLRQELIGAKVVAVDAVGPAAMFSFEKEGRALRLVLELGTDLFLLDASDRILSASSGPVPRERFPDGHYFAPLPKPSPETPSRLVGVADAPLPLAAAAEALFAPREEKKRADAIRRRLTAPLKAKLERVKRTVGKVREEASRGPDAEEHRRIGELLSQNLYRLQKGAQKVVLTEYSEQGAVEREVSLDPKLAPKEEVERHFHQYRRLLRGTEHAKGRLGVLEEEMRALEEELSVLKAKRDEELLGHSELLFSAGRKAEAQVHKPYKEFTGTTGTRILVGRGGADNDALTSLARPQDFWFHARGVPGSHVVVPLAKGATLGDQLVLDAAHLALHHSQLKGEPRGEVSYTQVKFVKKVKGGSPGQVTYTREKTIVVRLEPDRLERLLKSHQS